MDDTDHWDSDEIEKLPLDLQYLDEEKAVEEDPDLRKMLLEAITMLCATKAGRERVRASNAYLIVRELHKSEADKFVRLASENLADILIKKEEEINVDNYHDIEVPKHLVPGFEEMDAKYIADS